MATPTVDAPTLSLLQKSFANLSLDPSTAAAKISAALFPDTTYTDSEKAEVDRWVVSARHLGTSDGGEDAAKTAERLASLNTHLISRTTVLGSKPSVADVALYLHLAPLVSGWSAEQRTGENGFHHIVRFVDFVQNSPVFGLKLEEAERVAIDTDQVVQPIKPLDLKAEKERKKREKEAALAAGQNPETNSADTEASTKAKGKLETVAAAVGASVPVAREGGKKKEKKEKGPKPAKPAPAAAVEKPLSPCLIDLRVGHILKCIPHPDAEKLYVSTMAVGDPAGTENTTEYEGQIVRTVCSGLNGLIPLAEMQKRKVVAVCNLKPVTMRGVKSCAMVLAASPRDGDDAHAGPVELVQPPPESAAGERVFFEGWEGEPEPLLNPKKKVWESVQPGFTTTALCEAAFEPGAVEALRGKVPEGEGGQSVVAKLKTKHGVCVVSTLKGATIR